MKGAPAVFFTAAAPILSRNLVSEHPVRLVSCGSGTRLGEKLVVLVEVPVLHHTEAGGGAQVLAAAFVLLDGLMKGPELAQEGHVLLAQTNLVGTRMNILVSQ